MYIENEVSSMKLILDKSDESYELISKLLNIPAKVLTASEHQSNNTRLIVLDAIQKRLEVIVDKEEAININNAIVTFNQLTKHSKHQGLMELHGVSSKDSS